MIDELTYEEDHQAFPSNMYKVDGYPGIAWYVLGWETEPIEGIPAEWEWHTERTGRVVCVMVGGSRQYAFEPDELTPLPPEEIVI